VQGHVDFKKDAGAVRAMETGAAWRERIKKVRTSEVKT